MTTCSVCNSEHIEELLDLGKQPVTNRYIDSLQSEEALYPLKVGVCKRCGLTQLTESVSAKELTPRFNWISYNEPESHLDALVDIIQSLPNVSKESSKVIGISYKDDSTLERMKKLGFTHVYRVDPIEDLGIKDNRAGVETIQEKLTPETSSSIIGRHGLSDILIVRHILEHAHNPIQFIEALKKLVTPNGYMIVEVPDCEKAFKSLDYTTIWEEHKLYFTLDTFSNSLKLNGFEILRLDTFPYPFENSLVAILHVAPQSDTRLNTNFDETLSFGKNYDSRKAKIRLYLSEFNKKNGKIVLFGAGHLACSYLNYYDLGDFVEFLVDDNTNKQGMLMPGSHLPIKGSAALMDEDIKLCLLCFIPELETKIISKHSQFVDGGGVFASIFPGSVHALDLL